MSSQLKLAVVHCPLPAGVGEFVMLSVFHLKLNLALHLALCFRSHLVLLRLDSVWKPFLF